MVLQSVSTVLPVSVSRVRAVKMVSVMADVAALLASEYNDVRRTGPSHPPRLACTRRRRSALESWGCSTIIVAFILGDCRSYCCLC